MEQQIEYGDISRTVVIDAEGSTETKTTSFIKNGQRLAKIRYAIRKRIEEGDTATIYTEMANLLKIPGALDRGILLDNPRRGIQDIIICYTLLERE